MIITREFQSQNYNERALGCSIKYIVLHYTAMPVALEALRWLCDPRSKVSSHYFIDEEGKVFLLVPEHYRAWHAGTPSSWENEEDINSRSIGIEISNPGNLPFSQKQIKALCVLQKSILARHSLNPLNILGHSDVAPQRKIDPGPFFPWKYLARQGFGYWESRHGLRRKPSSPHRVQKKLKEFGYQCPLSGKWDGETQNVVRAFLLHFYPRLWLKEEQALQDPQHMDRISGYMDALLERLLERKICV